MRQNSKREIGSSVSIDDQLTSRQNLNMTSSFRFQNNNKVPSIEDLNYNTQHLQFKTTTESMSNIPLSSRQKPYQDVKGGIEMLKSMKTNKNIEFTEHYRKLQTLTQLTQSNEEIEVTRSPRLVYQKDLPHQASIIDKNKGFMPKYFYSFETSLSLGNQVLENGEIVWEELKFYNVLLTLMQEFTTSNFFVLPFAFAQGGFFYSNLFLLLSFFMTAYPMIVLVELKRLTNLTLRELCFVKWGFFGKYVADICVFFTHFSDLYSYIQALSIMIDKGSKFFNYQLSSTSQIWIQIILFYPLVCIPRFTTKQSIRYICDTFMAIGFFITVYLNINIIKTQDFATYSFFKTINVTQSIMNMFSCFEESISVFEIYRDRFTAKQTATFKKYIWLGHFCIYLMSFILCNLTWLAFRENTSDNVMKLYNDQSIIVFIGKLFFILAAVPAFGHLFAPLDLMSKDFLGIYSENNRLAQFKLKKFDKRNISYFPRNSELTGINWFKLCYFHPFPVQREMENLNKDTQTVKSNKRILFYLIKFFLVYFSVLFGMLTSQISNALFNLFQIFFKTPISLILPCHLYLIFGNLSKMEKIINFFIVVIGYILSFTSFVFLYEVEKK